MIGSGSRRGRWGLVVLLAVGLSSGCGSDLPKTYPVSGKVVLPKGGDPKRFAQMTVEFMSVIEPDTRGWGDVQPDGRFTLATWRAGSSLRGAIGGTHKVRILTAGGGGRFSRFETSGWEVTVPTTEDVVLKLE